jgi:ribosomal-protein-alanine N-acetyltransferase
MTQFTLWDTHHSYDATNYFIRDYASTRLEERVPDPLIVVLKDSNRIIGTLGCFWIDRQHRIMELGYNIGEVWWGNGYAAEGSKVLIEYAFSNYPIQRLQARIFSENAASYRVAEKLGMTFEGVLRSAIFRRGKHSDLCMFSILREEFLKVR